MLEQTGGFQTMACEPGIGEAQVHSGATALLPAIIGGFKKHVDSIPAGDSGFARSKDPATAGLLDSVVSSEPTGINSGNNVLRQYSARRT